MVTRTKSFQVERRRVLSIKSFSNSAFCFLLAGICSIGFLLYHGSNSWLYHWEGSLHVEVAHGEAVCSTEWVSIESSSSHWVWKRIDLLILSIRLIVEILLLRKVLVLLYSEAHWLEWIRHIAQSEHAIAEAGETDILASATKGDGLLLDHCCLLFGCAHHFDLLLIRPRMNLGIQLCLAEKLIVALHEEATGFLVEGALWEWHN